MSKPTTHVVKSVKADKLADAVNELKAIEETVADLKAEILAHALNSLEAISEHSILGVVKADHHVEIRGTHSTVKFGSKRASRELEDRDYLISELTLIDRNLPLDIATFAMKDIKKHLSENAIDRAFRTIITETRAFKVVLNK